MNAIADIYVAPCVSLQAELSRRPWLTPDERMAEAVEIIVAQRVEEATAEMVTIDQNELDCADAMKRGREECANEVDAILDRFDCESDDYAANVVEALNAWIKENT